MNFFLGCAIWSYTPWVGELFPEKSRPGDFLHLYSRRFWAVEGNTTFYAIPETTTVEKWREETPEGFRFFPKIPRELSHQGTLAPFIPRALRFLARMQGLQNRLGTIFLQLPPSYGPSYFNDLISFLRAWPAKECPFGVEVRHPAWFQAANQEKLEKTLSSLEIARVILDTRPIYGSTDNPQENSNRKKPKLPLRASYTTKHSLVRFISHPDPEKNEGFLLEWAKRVALWLQNDIEVSFFVHCPIEERSPDIAKRFQHLLEIEAKALKISIPPLPWNLLKPDPKQLTLL